MLREALFTKRTVAAPITIANPDSASVSARLQKLGATADQLTELPSLEAYVDDYEHRATAEFVEQLRAFTPDDEALLLVGTHSAAADKVVDFSRTAGGDLLLHLEDLGPGYASTNLQPPGVFPALNLRQLLDEIHQGSVQRLAAAYPGDHRTRYIVAGAAHSLRTGLTVGNGNWQVLIPSAPLK
jgi:hypothetical protein